MEKHNTPKTRGMELRLRLLAEQLQHTSRCLYLSFVYDPDDDRLFPEVFFQYVHEDERLAFALIDLLPVTIASLEGMEAFYQQALNDPLLATVARREIIQRWSDAIGERIMAAAAQVPGGRLPVAILYGVAALHPLGTPTELLELLAEIEPRDARTGRTVPIIVLVPGYLPLYTGGYYFLDRDSPLLPFYQESL